MAWERTSLWRHGAIPGYASLYYRPKRCDSRDLGWASPRIRSGGTGFFRNAVFCRQERRARAWTVLRKWLRQVQVECIRDCYGN